MAPVIFMAEAFTSPEKVAVVDEVRGRPLVGDDLRARHVLEEVPRRPRVVEVDVGRDQVVDLGGLDPDLPEPLHDVPVG